MKRLLRLLYGRGARLAYGRHLGRFWPIKALNQFLRSHLVPGAQPILVHVAGRKIYVDQEDSLSISIFGVYEPLTTQLVKDILRPGDAFVDIGANIGWFTLLAAPLVGDTGKVIAFEPEPANMAILKQNIALNTLHNVELAATAVADRNETMTLYLCPTDRGSHALYRTDDGRSSIQVAAVRLDDYLGAFAGRIALIKMDIEGAEGQAVAGMQSLLKRNPGVKIIMEFSPLALNKCGTAPADLLALLSNLGFAFQDINEEERHITPTTADALLAAYDDGQGRHTNILCTPSGG